MVLHPKSSYLGQSGNILLSMNTTGITESCHAVVHGLHWYCNRLSKHLRPADPKTKICYGKAVPESMLIIDFV